MNILSDNRPDRFGFCHRIFRGTLGVICLLLSMGVLTPAPVAAQTAADDQQKTPIGSLTDSLTNTTVGKLSTHILRFQLTDSLPVDARVRITFPPTFVLDSVSTVFYSDNDPGNIDPVLSPIQIIDQTLWAVLDSSGSPATPGSILQLEVAQIRNDTLQNSFAASLELYTFDTTLIFGPTLSAPFSLTPDTAVSFSIAPGGPQTITAGASLLFSATAYDRYGNRVDSVSVTYRAEPPGLGTLNGGIFTAIQTGTGRIIAETAALADTSGLITIAPGSLSTWQVDGLPPMVTAGSAPTAGNLTVTAYDAFGNRKTNYLGTMAFSATDTAAVLPATVASPYTFKANDSGRAVFDRTTIRLFRAGNDTILTSGGGRSVKSPIHIMAAAAASFTIVAPDTVTAGTPFALNITGATDAYGNTASGTVTLTLNPGDSLSPGGQSPVLPQIAVSNGTGTAPITLVLAGNYPVFGRGAGARLSSQILHIHPAGAGRFDWNLTGPLVSGVAFPAVATLTAYDLLGNLADNYNPGGTPVVLSAVNGDSMSNNVLGPGTFTAGIADLAALNVTYHGRGGQVRFAAGAGPALGTSEPVSVIALRADTLRFDQTTARRGVDTLTGSVIADVNGAGSVTITGITILSPYGEFPLSNITPFLPNSISGPATREYRFRWPVPAGLPQECIDFGVRIAGDFSAAAITDDFQGGPCVSITAAARASIVSLTPDPAAYAAVEYRAVIANTGPGNLQITLDSVAMVLSDSSGVTDTARAVGSGQLFLVSTGQITLPLRTQHPGAFAGDSAFASLRLVGTEAGKRFDTTITAPSAVHYVAPAQLLYIAGSLTPDTLQSGEPDTLRVRIGNSGGATVDSVDRANTYLTLSGLADTLVVRFDNTLTPLQTLPPGDTTLAFVLSGNATRVAAGTYAASFTLSGYQSNRPYSASESLADSTVFIAPARLRIDSVWAVAPNLPFVSTTQNFQVSAAITNTGFEPIDSIVLRLAADAGALFTDTISLPTLTPGASATTNWPVTADVSPVALETFTASVQRAVGTTTLKPADIDPPLDAQAALQVQSPATVGVELRVSAPPEATDLRVAAGSDFIVTGRFTNTGEAQIGTGDLVLAVDPAITLSSPAIQPAGPNDTVYWTLTAPAADTTGIVTLGISTAPPELNTNTPAVIGTPATNLNFQFAFETPPLTVFDVQYHSGLLSSDLPILTFRWTNPDRSNLFPILLRRCEFGVVAGDRTTTRSPLELFASARLDIDSVSFNAVLSSTTIRFGSDTLLRIAPGDTHSVQLTVMPRPATNPGDLRVFTQASLWSAIERSVGSSGLPVAIENESGRPIDMISPVMYRSAETATCYPNPFRGGSESVRVQYRLPADAQTTVKVYTTSGVEVWTREYAAATDGGRAGDNEITWDGRNGRGSAVFDGVYFMRIQAPGLDETLKIVVMK